MSGPEQLDNAGLCMELQNLQGSGRRKGVPFGRNTFPKEFAANQLLTLDVCWHGWGHEDEAGRNEPEARRDGIEYRVAKIPMAGVLRTRTVPNRAAS
jgi:hypothetical protein